MTVILRYSTEFGSSEANYVKVIEDRPMSRQQCSEKNLILAIYDLWRYSQRLSIMSALTRDTPCQRR